jgi:hypothetical protein
MILAAFILVPIAGRFSLAVPVRVFSMPRPSAFDDFAHRVPCLPVEFSLGGGSVGY